MGIVAVVSQEGNMYHGADIIYTVDVDGEEISVSIATGRPVALGHCYWPGQCDADLGRAAEAVVAAHLGLSGR